MSCESINVSLGSGAWLDVLQKLGLKQEPAYYAMEAFFTMFKLDIEDAMQTAGERKLKEILARKDIQTAFRLAKSSGKAEEKP